MDITYSLKENTSLFWPVISVINTFSEKMCVLYRTATRIANQRYSKLHFKMQMSTYLALSITDVHICCQTEKDGDAFSCVGSSERERCITQEVVSYQCKKHGNKSNVVSTYLRNDPVIMYLLWFWHPHPC